THALLTGSPALDAGDPTDAPEWDQRGEGFYRIVGKNIDIGAYEEQVRAAPSLHPNPSTAVGVELAALLSLELPCCHNPRGWSPWWHGWVAIPARLPSPYIPSNHRSLVWEQDISARQTKEASVAQAESRTHYVVSLRGDSVVEGVRDFSNQAMSAEKTQKSS